MKRKKTKLERKPFWISYDLGVKGDYSGLYEWLDAHDAVECGDSLAFVTWQGAVDKDLTSEVKADLKKAVKLSKHDRIYLIWKDMTSQVKGRFIFGKRKASPWTGYSNEETVVEEEA